MQRYGPHLFHVAKIIFLARFIQLLLHHYRNRNHRKYLRYDEIDDVNDELIDELVEKNLDLIKFNNSILKSIYYNSRN
nr:13949_t:CDS:2 [Entrophospora candida]